MARGDEKREFKLVGADEDVDIEGLRSLLTAHEPAETSGYLAVPVEGRLTVSGSTVPLVGRQVFVPSETSGLLLPEGARLPAPIDYLGVYITLDDYVQLSLPDGSRAPSRLLARVLAGMHDPKTLMAGLAVLNWVTRRGERLQELQNEFRRYLAPEPRRALDGHLRAAGGERRIILARQPILAALRYLLTSQPPEEPTESIPPGVAAMMLAHAVASDLNTPPEETDSVAAAPGPLALDIIRLNFLYPRDDMYASIDRTVRLWRDFGGTLDKYPLRQEPVRLLTEATGLELEELLGLGFLLFAHTDAWEPRRQPHAREDLGSGMDPEKLSAFRGLVSATTEEYRAAFEGRTSHFDFLPFQEKPVLHSDQGLLVLDQDYLWERVTSGLYWIVHDYEKGRSESDCERWRQAYSEMVEMMCEDQLRQMAPEPLPGGGETFYSEEDLGVAFPGRRCDAAIDFGNVFALFEIVSGHVGVGTRIEGKREELLRDTDRLVLAKCHQLDATASQILADESRLTGFPPVPGRRILPVVVVGGGYPTNPFTLELIESRLREQGLLADHRNLPLAVISVAELEMLEGLAEEGPGPHEVLSKWTMSSLRGLPLSVSLHRYHRTLEELRPRRMRERVDATFESITALLQLSKG